MTQGDIDRGQVIVMVGFAPLKPAEFVIVRIQQEVGEEVLQDLGTDPTKVFTVFNKADLVGDVGVAVEGGLRVSARTGEGVDELRSEMLRRLVPARAES